MWLDDFSSFVIYFFIVSSFLHIKWNDLALFVYIFKILSRDIGISCFQKKERENALAVKQTGLCKEESES